ncbi:MAG: response regulator [Desulfobacterales bacterium]|jgi:CheY-like chemotaxis protein
MQTNKKENNERQPVILFADDDATCLDVGVKILESLGYNVLEARDGQEAIEVFLNNQSEVDLVILDMKMPYNGGTTFLELKKINANVRVVIASGYAKDQQIKEMMEKGCRGFIQKPFRIKSLSQKITNALSD